MSNIVVAALYKFVSLPDFHELREPLLDHCLAQNIRGTLLLAEEGINGTVAGSREAIDSLLAYLKADPRLADLSHKESFDSSQPFYRMKVKLKKEIVTMGIDGIDPNEVVGTYVKPKDWNALISDPEHVNSLISMGEIKFQSDDFDEAVSFWQKAQDITPDVEVLSRINEAKENMNRDNEFEIGEQSLVVSLENKIALAKELTIKGDHVNSVKAWKQLLEDNREMPEIWNGMADSLSAAGHVDRALQCRQKATSLELENSIEIDTEIVQEADLIAAGIEAKEIIENMDNSPEIDANVSIEWYNKGINLFRRFIVLW